MKERNHKKKPKKAVTIGLIGLITVMSALLILFNIEIDANQEPRYIVEILNDDPENYLEKRININDGSVHYHFNYTERMGSISHP